MHLLDSYVAYDCFAVLSHLNAVSAYIGCSSEAVQQGQRLVLQDEQLWDHSHVSPLKSRPDSLSLIGSAQHLTLLCYACGCHGSLPSSYGGGCLVAMELSIWTVMLEWRGHRGRVYRVWQDSVWGGVVGGKGRCCLWRLAHGSGRSPIRAPHTGVC